jgi:RNA polymerase sigma factor (sigma-70 family)
MRDTTQHFVGALFARHRRDLLAYLRRRAGRDNAHDLLQEAFLRVLQRTGTAEIADPPAYLHRIAGNLATDFARRQKVETRLLVPDASFDDTPSEEVPADERLEQNDRSRLLTEAIDMLPPRCREVFVMRMHENIPQDEIAQRLGITRNMVDRHIRVAIERCRLALK